MRKILHCVISLRSNWESLHLAHFFTQQAVVMVETNINMKESVCPLCLDVDMEGGTSPPR